MTKIFANEFISERFVHEWVTLTRTWTEGDKFRLKDVDGDGPTGEYTISSIKVQVVRLGASIATHTRVWFQDRKSGSWTRIVHVVPFEPKDTKDAYIRRIVALVNEAIEEHGETIVRVPCEHGGTDHGITDAKAYEQYVYLYVNDLEYLNE